jgi:hypothetical protein
MDQNIEPQRIAYLMDRAARCRQEARLCRDPETAEALDRLALDIEAEAGLQPPCDALRMRGRGRGRRSAERDGGRLSRGVAERRESRA